MKSLPHALHSPNQAVLDRQPLIFFNVGFSDSLQAEFDDTGRSALDNDVLAGQKPGRFQPLTFETNGRGAFGGPKGRAKLFNSE
jgi:hypothetical protein